jgi:hypothetical protein
MCTEAAAQTLQQRTPAWAVEAIHLESADFLKAYRGLAGVRGEFQIHDSSLSVVHGQVSGRDHSPRVKAFIAFGRLQAR